MSHLQTKNNNKKKFLHANQQHETQQNTTKIFMGPIPDPLFLLQYNKIDNTFANRILQLTESEAAHRRAIDEANIKLEKERIHLDDKKITLEYAHIKRRDWEAKIGQMFGFIIAITAILAGSHVALNGAPTAGAFMTISGLTGLIGTFIYGRTQENK